MCFSSSFKIWWKKKTKYEDVELAQSYFVSKTHEKNQVGGNRCVSIKQYLYCLANGPNFNGGFDDDTEGIGFISQQAWHFFSLVSQLHLFWDIDVLPRLSMHVYSIIYLAEDFFSARKERKKNLQKRKSSNMMLTWKVR